LPAVPVFLLPYQKTAVAMSVQVLLWPAEEAVEVVSALVQDLVFGEKAEEMLEALSAPMLHQQDKEMLAVVFVPVHHWMAGRRTKKRAR